MYIEHKDKERDMSDKKQVRKLLLGNEAFARGAYEAGVTVASAYPGTPSTEIPEALAQYKGELYCEWAPNEKVAMEVAIGASMSGARALATMKHVGLNVAADPLFTAAYIGVNGGLVLVVADDPGMYSSQNEQDTRMMARAAHVPVLEPADSQEAKDYVIKAYEISEEYDTPVIVRSTTRLSHSQGLVNIGERITPPAKTYEKNIAKNVMVPANAQKRHPFVVAREERLTADASAMADLNRIELRDRSIGIITSGIPYQYVREACPDASVLKLGLVNPLPRRLIEEFAAEVDELYVFEELEPLIEEQVRAWGIACKGKELFPLVGEYSANLLRKVLYNETVEARTVPEIPGRPPVLCPGCPHRSVFSVMKKLKLHAAGDIGCYTLGASPPLGVIETTVCMGASIGTLHGMEKAHGKDYIKNWVAVIGDSTFLHSGINSLMNMVYNGGTGTVVIMDNSITAMTGHQHNPATGKTLQGDPAPTVSLKKLCEAVGVRHVTEMYAFDLKDLEALLKQEVARDEVSVIITQSPCALLKENPPIRNQYKVDAEICRACGLCLKPGCPALTKDANGKTKINDTLCNGCGLCFRTCPFGAIKMVDSVIDQI